MNNITLISTLGMVVPFIAIFAVAYLSEAVNTVEETVKKSVNSLDTFVVPATLGGECAMDDVIAVIEAEEAVINRIDSLCEKAMEDIANCAKNNEYNEFGFHCDSLKVEYALEEELLSFTFFTEFRPYAKKKEQEVRDYRICLEGCIANEVMALQEVVSEEIDRFNSQFIPYIEEGVYFEDQILAEDIDYLRTDLYNRYGSYNDIYHYIYRALSETEDLLYKSQNQLSLGLI